MCVVMNTIFYAFVCRHMVYFYIRVGGFQDLALRSKLLIHPLNIAARCVVLYVRAGFLCVHNFYKFTYTWCVQVLRSPKEAFAAAMQSWCERFEKCVCLQGDYVEK